MKSSLTPILIAAGLLLTTMSKGAVLVQQTSGSLAFEAEDFDSRVSGSATSFEVITSTVGSKKLPASTNAVGSALYTNGTEENAFATYKLRFTSSGTYYLYSRYSFYERATPTDYYNEDSFFLPSAFNQAATTAGTWAIEPLNVYSYVPGGANANEGLYFLWDEGTTPFVITGASLETPVDVTFTIRGREGGATFDRFIFTTTRQTITLGNNATLDGIASVPEPSRVMLILFGVLALVGTRRRSVIIKLMAQ